MDVCCGDCEDCFKPTHKKTVYAIHGKANINNFKKYEELALEQSSDEEMNFPRSIIWSGIVKYIKEE